MTRETIQEGETIVVQDEREGLVKKAGSLSNAARVKKELEPLLAAEGYASKAYLVLLPCRPTDKWVSESGGELIEGNPTISSKDGTVMYNFSGKLTKGRLGGNLFLPVTVGPKLFGRFIAAKEADDMAKKAKQRKTTIEEEDLEAGESVD